MTINIDGDTNYLTRNPHWHAEDSPHKARWIKVLLDANGIQPSTVIDVGCGAGEVLVALQSVLDPKTTYAGYDVSHDAAHLSQPKQNPKLTFITDDFITTETEAFDLILLIDVVEHIEDYMGFLRKISSRARHFIFHFPLDLHVSSIVRHTTLLNTRRDVGHLHYFTRETVLATLVDTGFDILDQSFTAGSLELPQPKLRTRLLSLPRKVTYKLSPALAARWLGGFSLLVLAKPVKT